MAHLRRYVLWEPYEDDVCLREAVSLCWLSRTDARRGESQRTAHEVWHLQSFALQYSDSKLYNQLLYFDSLFDTEKVRANVAGTSRSGTSLFPPSSYPVTNVLPSQRKCRTASRGTRLRLSSYGQ
jgi:hypothetical protein